VGLVAELAERGLKIDYRVVRKFVDGDKLSFKKTVVATERDRSDIANRRVQRRKYQDLIEPERSVFIAETWAVVMDNLGSYKAIRQFIRVAGVKLFMQPKYAPDLHPVEQIFAELKCLLRKALHASSKRSAPQVLKSSLRLLRRVRKLFLNFSGYAEI
jgi:hypothetical protein